MKENISRLETAKARLEAEIEALYEALNITEALDEETYQVYKPVVDAFEDLAFKTIHQDRADIEDINTCLEHLRKAETTWTYLTAWGIV